MRSVNLQDLIEEDSLLEDLAEYFESIAEARTKDSPHSRNNFVEDAVAHHRSKYPLRSQGVFME